MSCLYLLCLSFFFPSLIPTKRPYSCLCWNHSSNVHDLHLVKYMDSVRILESTDFSLAINSESLPPFWSYYITCFARYHIFLFCKNLHFLPCFTSYWTPFWIAWKTFLMVILAFICTYPRWSYPLWSYYIVYTYETEYPKNLTPGQNFPPGIQTLMLSHFLSPLFLLPYFTRYYNFSLGNWSGPLK